MDRTALRKVILTVAVALLVATAGCSGFGGGDGDSGTPTPTNTSADGTDGADGGDGSDGNDSSDGSDGGYGVAGDELDGETIESKSQTAVESAGSYTFTTSLNSSGTTGDGQSFSSTATVSRQVDMESEQGVSTTESTQTSGDQTRETTIAIYTNGNDSYNKIGIGENATYRTPSDGFVRPVNVTGFGQNYAEIVDGFNWETAGSESVDGVGVTRYEATGVANASLLVGDGSNVPESSASMLIDSDGIVREVAVSVTFTRDGATTNTDVSFTLSDVGSTTVSEPGWVSDAKSS